MFKPSPTLLKAAPNKIKRMPLSSKQAGKGFYKGTRVGSMGWHTKHGKYIIDLRKVRTFVPPADDDAWKSQIKLEELVSRYHGWLDDSMIAMLMLQSQKPFVSSHIQKPKAPEKTKTAEELLEDPYFLEAVRTYEKTYGKVTGETYLARWKELYNKDVQLAKEDAASK
jgi:Mitochondrial ribosomal protein L27